MTLSQLEKLFIGKEKSEEIKKALASKEPITYFTGLAGSAASMAIGAAAPSLTNTLVIANEAEDAGYLYSDLSALHGADRVLMFPSGYRRAIKYGQPDEPSRILRTEVLSKISSGAKGLIIVTYPMALAEMVASKKSIDQHTLLLESNAEQGLDNTITWLRENDFKQVDYVYEPGQFANRGSIIDIFGYSLEYPLRVDFFGDEIDSIRTFDIQTQLSQEKLKSISITSGIPSASETKISLLEFIGDKSLIVLRDYERIISSIETISQEQMNLSALASQEGETDSVSKIVSGEMIKQRLDALRQVRIISQNRPNLTGNVINFNTSPQAIYHKNFDLLGQSLTEYQAKGYEIFILSESQGQFARLKSIFEDRKEHIDFIPILAILHEGFVDNEKKFCVFTDHQIFDRFHRYTLRSDSARQGKVSLSLKELNSIEPGDYVVHIDHGVGRYAGLIRTRISGHVQEMIKVVYANDDMIFVPIHALHKLSKYRGKEGVPPKINRLGSGAWNRVKERTKSRLKDIAKDLIALYSARKDQKGFSFSPDSYLQHELEASFIYEDTPDQLSATQAVKADMESDKPMDRLVCGDVGFGKTEVAIRAAFKAATDNKQTAILVPTTVLAQQHYQTFSERLKDFPVNVEYLTRARTAAQTKEILQKLEQGQIDILIGTHKILGKSVKFKDLGLLVVDEEQKFGVSVKEKLRQMKTEVDTLTMSATPIPRTLQFSLMGARDLSAINTPPPNRHPIITQVTESDDEIIAEAVNFELSRNGQVFVVNNRIEGLIELETRLRRLVPDARIIVAHGQMPPEKLEKAILDFSRHDYDILLSTTIIESGVDMPRVNTMIVNNAQNFGLSELHQLRGRVGRSSRRAFCYLLTPPKTLLSEVAHRRLQAIESFSELGSGINIAMQDLDIRGAGNLLGAEQSGFIADLGFETYQRILSEAVSEARLETASTSKDDISKSSDLSDYVADTVIDTDMELLFPEDYVPGESERITLYRELDSITREMDLLEFRKRLEDRFGPIPRQAQELTRIPTLRRIGRKFGIVKIALKQDKMFLYFPGEGNEAYYQSKAFGQLLTLLQTYPARCQIRQTGDKRSFAISDVTSVEEALNIIQSLPSNDA